MKNLIIPLCQMVDRTSVDEHSDKIFAVGFVADAHRSASIVLNFELLKYR